MADSQASVQQGGVTVNQSGSSVFGDVINKYIYQIGREYVELKGVPATPQNVEDAVMGISQNPEMAANTPTGKKVLDYVFGKGGQAQLPGQIAQTGINIPIDEQPVNNVVQGQGNEQAVPQEQVPVQEGMPDDSSGVNPAFIAVPAAAAAGAGGYKLAQIKGQRDIIPSNRQTQPSVIDTSSSPIEGDLLGKQALPPGQSAQGTTYEGQVNRPQLDASPKQLPNQQQAQLAQSMEAEQVTAQEYKQTGQQPKQVVSSEATPIETSDIMSDTNELKPVDKITTDDGSSIKSKSGKLFEKTTDVTTGKTIYTSGNTKFVADEVGNLYPVPAGVTNTSNELGVAFMKKNAATNTKYRKFIQLLRVIR